MKPLNMEVRQMSDCSVPVRRALTEALEKSGASWAPCFVINMVRLGADDRAYVTDFLKQHSTGRTHSIGHFVLVEDENCYFYLKMMERWA